MISTALAAIALSVSAQAEPAPPKITAVSMFKNGYSFVAHATPVNGSGEYVIEQPPAAAHGTFWHLPAAGLSIRKATSTTIETASKVNVASVAALLEENVGKQVTIDLIDLPSISGTLMASIANQLMVRTSEGVVLVDQARIKRLTFKEEPQIKTGVKTQKRVLKLDVEARGPGVISTVGLEHGLAWVPAYAIDITDDKELDLVAKATVVNELADLDNVEASFITGFPNVRFAGVTDPLTNPAALDQLLQMLVQSSFVPNAPAPSIMTQNAMSRAGEMSAGADFTGGFVPQGTGQQLEDLFFYRLEGITLKKGDRAAYTLFTTKAPYQHLFTWDVNRAPLNYYSGIRDPGTDHEVLQEVWHSVTFKNNSGKPLTTAVATTFEKGQILGQDILRYTTPGVEAEARITKALDIHVESIEEELARERGALRLPSGNTYDLITVKGTLTAKNNRKGTSKMRISTTFDGDLVSADGKPKVTKGTKGLGDLNAQTSLEWRTDVGSGNSLKLTYSYKMYVRTP